jgi:hypothetical protein
MFNQRKIEQLISLITFGIVISFSVIYISLLFGIIFSLIASLIFIFELFILEKFNKGEKLFLGD